MNAAAAAIAAVACLLVVGLFVSVAGDGLEGSPTPPGGLAAGNTSTGTAAGVGPEAQAASPPPAPVFNARCVRYRPCGQAGVRAKGEGFAELERASGLCTSPRLAT